jgi:Fe-S-cluster containining protein
LIAGHLGITSAEIDQKLLASPGAVVMNRLTKQTGRVPTIVPDRDANGVCVFLDQATGLCTIHPVAPFGCGYIDDHMSPEEGNKRSMALLVNVIRDPLYMARWQRLWNAGRRAPGPEKLRARDSMDRPGRMGR